MKRALASKKIYQKCVMMKMKRDECTTKMLIYWRVFTGLLGNSVKHWFVHNSGIAGFISNKPEVSWLCK